MIGQFEVLEHNMNRNTLQLKYNLNVHPNLS